MFQNLPMPHTDAENIIEAADIDPNPSAIPHNPRDFFQQPSFTSPQQVVFQSQPAYTPSYLNSDAHLSCSSIYEPHTISPTFASFLQPPIDPVVLPPSQFQGQSSHALSGQRPPHFPSPVQTHAQPHNTQQPHVHTQMHTHIHALSHAQTQPQTQAQAQTQAQTQVQTQAQGRTQAQTQAQAHTQAQTQAPVQAQLHSHAQGPLLEHSQTLHQTHAHTQLQSEVPTQAQAQNNAHIQLPTKSFPAPHFALSSSVQPLHASQHSVQGLLLASDNVPYLQPPHLQFLAVNQIQPHMSATTELHAIANPVSQNLTRQKEQSPPGGARTRTKRFKKRAKRSLVWTFFTELEDDPNKAKCNLCGTKVPRGRKLARNTTNLKKHLCHRHPEVKDSLSRTVQPTALNGHVVATIQQRSMHGADSPSISPSDSDPACASPDSTLRGSPSQACGSTGETEPFVPVPVTDPLPASAAHRQEGKGARDRFEPEEPTIADVLAVSASVADIDERSKCLSLLEKSLPIRNGNMRPINAARMADLVALSVPSSRKALDQWFRDNLQACRSQNFNIQDILDERAHTIRTKIMDMVRNVRDIVVSVESVEHHQLIRCQFFDNNSIMRVVYLAAVPAMNASQYALCLQGSPEHRSSSSPLPAADNRLKELLACIYKELGNWQLREKVVALTISANIELNQEPLFVKVNALTNTASESELTRASEGSEFGQLPCNAGDRGSKKRAVPLLSCVVRSLEGIAQIIYMDTRIQRTVLGPISRATRQAQSDEVYCRETVGRRPPKQIGTSGSRSVGDILESVRHFTTDACSIERALRRSRDGQEDDILNLNLRDLEDLKNVLVIFAKAKANLNLSSNRQQGPGHKRLSFAIPVLHDIERDLRAQSTCITHALVAPTIDAMIAVQNLYRALEGNPLFICATLLDPCFRGYGFSSGRVLEAAKAAVVDHCREELCRRGDDCSEPEYPVGAQAADFFRGRQDDLESVRQALEAYIMEQASGMEVDALSFWQERKCRCPLLSAVAIPYLLIPSSCEPDRRLMPFGCCSEAADAPDLLFVKANLVADQAFDSLLRGFSQLFEESQLHRTGERRG